MDSCHLDIGCLQVAGKEEGLQLRLRTVAANVLNKRSPATDKAWFTSLGGWAKCLLFLIVES